MLKISSPYIRETAVMDDKEGKAIVLKIEPPWYTIGFRLRNSRQTYYLKVLDAYMAARYTANPEIKQEKPQAVRYPSVKEEMLKVLQSHGRLNIAQVLKQLRDKGIHLSRGQAGEWLDTLKELHKVKQDGFSYTLIGKEK